MEGWRADAWSYFCDSPLFEWPLLIAATSVLLFMLVFKKRVMCRKVNLVLVFSILSVGYWLAIPFFIILWGIGFNLESGRW